MLENWLSFYEDWINKLKRDAIHLDRFIKVLEEEVEIMKKIRELLEKKGKK